MALVRLATVWARRRRWAATLLGLAVGLPLGAAALRLGPAAGKVPLAAAALVLPAALALAMARRRPPDPRVAAAHLDRRLPALGDSAGLLLATARVPPLQRLQQRRTAVALLAHEDRELARTLPRRQLMRAGAALLAGLALALLVTLLPVPPRTSAALRSTAGGQAQRPAAPPTPLLRALAVTVQPPAYTGRRVRTAATLGITAEEGATVRWQIEAAPAVTAAALLFDESDRLPLRRLAGNRFVATATARSPRLVRLLLDGPGGELWRSVPARLDVLADRPPSLELLAPATTLVERDGERPGTLVLEAALADDYGVAGAELAITVAAGSGEGVSFAERRLPLPVRRTAARQRVRHALDLAAAGLVADSELYLRVEARDGRRPGPGETAGGPQPNVVRSPTVVVRPRRARVDSAPLGEGLPLIAGPELFRSQRQVVLDTERLIAEAPRLAAAEVMRRSREISFDQRALRLRYGTLLGQELEEGRPAGPEEELPSDASPGGAAEGVPGGLVHEHDSAESATFLPAAVRQKLRGMLAAMWDAEGALATGAPRPALPHELRALGLLKQVQQADRVYVRKSAGEGAPLEPSRRLTGELGELRPLEARQPPPAPEPVVDAALLALAALGDGAEGPATRGTAAGSLPAGALATLAPALAARARAGSAPALAALPALDALAAGEPLAAGARQTLERALWELVPPPQAPVRRSAPRGALWERYRSRLGGAP